MSWITKNWIARYLKPGHKFQIGNDLWQLSGNPINEAEYEDFSRAVYKCKLLEEREGIISPAVVKIWMQTPEINTYDGWFYAGELYDLYLAENLNIAGTSDGASHFDSFGKFVAAGNSDIANDSNLTGHSDSTVGLDSDGHSDIASHPGSDSHANSVNHSDSACNSNSTTHPLCTSHSPSPNNPNVEITSPETQHSEPWTSELTCLNLLNESYSKLHHTTISKEPSNPPPYNYKPFPYAIGLTQYKQPRNFPLEGGYLVYLVMEKLPGECIHPGVFWGYWDRCERDAFRGAFEEGVGILQKLSIENRDKAMRNLLYDREGGRCYFIDWETWRYRREEAWPPLPILQYSYDMIRERELGMGDEDEGEERWDRE